MSELTDEPTTEEKYAQIESIVAELGDAHSNRAKRDALTSIKCIVNGEEVPVTDEPVEDDSDGGVEVDAKWLDLKSLTVKELQALATEENIELGDAKLKADILAIIEAAVPKVEELPDTTGWHALVTAPDGTVVYDGLCPVPDELVTITPEMLANGEVFSFELTPPDENAA